MILLIFFISLFPMLFMSFTDCKTQTVKVNQLVFFAALTFLRSIGGSWEEAWYSFLLGGGVVMGISVVEFFTKRPFLGEADKYLLPLAGAWFIPAQFPAYLFLSGTFSLSTHLFLQAWNKKIPFVPSLVFSWLLLNIRDFLLK